MIINKNGARLARKIKESFEDTRIIKIHGKGPPRPGAPAPGKGKKEPLTNLVGRVFNEYDGLIFIAGLGIVVRLISPFIKDKFSDPAVVCLDTAGRYAISVLSGHEGGANNLSYLTARCLDALPVITTGTEAHKKIIVGLGARRGIDAGKVKKALLTALKEKNIPLEKVRLAASIDLKRNEKGLIKACSELNLPLIFIPKETVRNFKGFSSSKVVKRHIGLAGVCEPCAILAGRKAKLICPKQILDGVTVALAREG